MKVSISALVLFPPKKEKKKAATKVNTKEERVKYKGFHPSFWGKGKKTREGNFFRAFLSPPLSNFWLRSSEGNSPNASGKKTQQQHGSNKRLYRRKRQQGRYKAINSARPPPPPPPWRCCSFYLVISIANSFFPPLPAGLLVCGDVGDGGPLEKLHVASSPFFPFFRVYFLSLQCGKWNGDPLLHFSHPGSFLFPSYLHCRRRRRRISISFFSCWEMVGRSDGGEDSISRKTSLLRISPARKQLRTIFFSARRR